MSLTINVFLPILFFIEIFKIIFHIHRIEVLSGMSGPKLMTASMNTFVDGINRSILVGIFGKKPTASKDENTYPEVDLSRFTLIEGKHSEAKIQQDFLTRYNY